MDTLNRRGLLPEHPPDLGELLGEGRGVEEQGLGGVVPALSLAGLLLSVLLQGGRGSAGHERIRVGQGALNRPPYQRRPAISPVRVAWRVRIAQDTRAQAQ